MVKPLFPACGLAGSLNGLNPKSKFLTIGDDFRNDFLFFLVCLTKFLTKRPESCGFGGENAWLRALREDRTELRLF